MFARGGGLSFIHKVGGLSYARVWRLCAARQGVLPHFAPFSAICRAAARMKGILLQILLLSAAVEQIRKRICNKFRKKKKRRIRAGRAIAAFRYSLDFYAAVCRGEGKNRARAGYARQRCRKRRRKCSSRKGAQRPDREERRAQKFCQKIKNSPTKGVFFKSLRKSSHRA